MKTDKDNVPDFRFNSRSIRLNPFFEFLYWRMNYHAEHHMYAGVPCYNLKRLSQVIADDIPERKTLIGAWREKRVSPPNLSTSLLVRLRFDRSSVGRPHSSAWARRWSACFHGQSSIRRGGRCCGVLCGVGGAYWWRSPSAVRNKHFRSHHNSRRVANV